ncbi:MAG: hypothetical protein HY063_04215 [Bacteroidetes bacterium]|nr:hypothetical protein [Bacteroidota bacterium]
MTKPAQKFFNSIIAYVRDSDWMEINQRITDRQLLLTDTDVKSRNFNHWKNEKIVQVTEEAGKRLKLNLVEYIWLCTVEKARNLGLPLPAIKKSKEMLFQEQDFDRTFRENAILKNQAIEKIKNTPMDEGTKKMMIDLLEKGGMGSLLKKKDFSINFFNFFVIASLIIPNDVAVIFFPDGDCFPYAENLHGGNASVKELLTVEHTYVSLKRILAEFIGDESKKDFLMPFRILNEKEMSVIREIRSGNVSEITIKFIGKEKNQLQITTKKHGELTRQQEAEVVNAFALKNYQSITLKHRADGKIYFEREHIKK